jgi:large subunit ribosomal protein L24
MGTATTTEHKRVDIRRNDTVKVMTGRDTGKEGRVLRVLPDEGTVLVEHVMMVKEARAPESAAQHQGWNRRAGAGHSLCRTWPWCATCGPVRVGHEVRGDRKVRVCKKCGTTLDK